ncbi:TetR/AcrR family transcriptional regulator [Luteimicrobium sp. DT211]|uniref:TetR/AcrR family transcriptional regulator n=1 Tax=Luteimicrobium sp. DT211 TaxID=3393412 RepID=UPI003CF5CF35
MSTEPVRRRRRGAELEAALLDAAWDELTDVGYARLTMESVAARAETGVAVLYRRWANKDELTLAALEHRRTTTRADLPDTGSLRGDLLAALRSMSESNAAFWVVVTGAAFSGFLAESGLTPGQVRERILGEGAARRVDALYRRAHERGEIDLDRIPTAVLTLPFDLVRHDLLMALAPLKPARVRAIVDELFLPLVAHYGGGSGEVPGGA